MYEPFRGCLILEAEYKWLGRYAYKFYAQKFIPEFKDKWPTYWEFGKYLLRTQTKVGQDRGSRIPCFWTKTDEALAKYRESPMTFSRRERRILNKLDKQKFKYIVFFDPATEQDLQVTMADLVWEETYQTYAYLNRLMYYFKKDYYESYIDTMRPFMYEKDKKQRYKQFYLDCLTKRTHLTNFTEPWTCQYKYAIKSYQYGVYFLTGRGGKRRINLMEKGMEALDRKLANFKQQFEENENGERN